MANSPQARKRARQAVKRREHNQSMMTELRTYIKNVLKALANGEKDTAKTAFQLTQKRIDKLVTKGLVHKNRAARVKSRLNTRLKAIS